VRAISRCLPAGSAIAAARKSVDDLTCLGVVQLFASLVLDGIVSDFTVPHGRATVCFPVEDPGSPGEVRGL